jgi:hypothetical protein
VRFGGFESTIANVALGDKCAIPIMDDSLKNLMVRGGDPERSEGEDPRDPAVR